MGSNSFTLDDLDLTPADRAALLDFFDSWLEHGRPILFVGAGMSRYNAVPRPGAPASAEIKDWAGLVDTLRQRLAGGDDSALKRLPADYLRLAQLHETQFQRVRLLDAVEEALANTHFDPGPAHARLTRFQWEAIITTNYDDLLERTFAASATRDVTKVVWDGDLTRRRTTGTLLLIKMHGDLQDRDSIVLTEEDYRCYEQRRPGVALKVKQLLLEHPALFVGFSLSDPNVAAIDGWIRDTTGQFKLPSVALVHSEPLSAERDMWARRGIKLVHVRAAETLERVFDALHGERQRREQGKRERREPMGDREMDKILERRDEGWEADAAKLLVKLADGAHETEFASAARYALQGGLRNVPAESVQKVIDALTGAERRKVLLRAQAHGISEAGGSGRKVLDIEQHLLDDVSLSPTERGGLLAIRATRAQQAGRYDVAREDLFAARSLDLDTPTRETVQKLLHQVLLLSGDAVAIANELLDAPLAENSLAYSRRGSDALLVRGRAAAGRWYTEALSHARNGDEKTAALMGLLACADPSDWSGASDLDEQRTAILDEERPRAKRVFDLELAAGRKLLAAYRVGPRKASDEPHEAIGKLREALAEADDMGWPKSAGPNLTTASDNLAHGVVGLLVGNQSKATNILQAVAFTIERGLFGIARHFDEAVFDRLASDQEATARARVLLQPRPEAMFMARSRSLLRSTLLPLLADDEITDHVLACLDAVELRSADFFERSASESHLELLAEHFHAVSPAAAAHLLHVFASVLREATSASLLRASWLRPPIEDWVKTGTVLSSDTSLREFVSALSGLFTRGLVGDAFVKQSALRALGELVEAGVLSDGDRHDFEGLLNAELELAISRPEQDEISVLDLSAARVRLGPWVPSAAASAVFAGTYAKLKNSTAIGRWLTLIAAFADSLGADERANVARDIAAYVEATLKERHRVFGPYPQWAAEAISQGATSGILPASEALELLQRLGAKYPEVLPVAVDLPGIDLDAMEEEILAALAVESDDVSLLRWCQDLPSNRPSPRLETIALGGLHARDARSRQLAYWSCAALAKTRNLSDAGRAALAHAIGTFGAIDRDWHVRSASIATAARILEAFDNEKLLRLVAAGANDAIAGVRRAASFLARSAHVGE